MAKRPKPGEILRELITRKRYSQKAVAVTAGMSPSVLSELIHGKRPFNPEFCVKLEHVLGVKAEFLMNLQSRYDVTLARKKIEKLPRNGKDKDLLSTPRGGRPFTPIGKSTERDVRKSRSARKRIKGTTHRKHSAGANG